MCQICSEDESQTHWLQRKYRRRRLITPYGRRLPHNDYLLRRIAEKGLFPPDHLLCEGFITDPKNQEELRKILGRQHPSISTSVSNKEYYSFVRCILDAQCADEGSSNTFSQENVLMAYLPDPGAAQLHYARRKQLHLEPFYPELDPPKPSLYYGELPTTIDDPVRNALHNYIMPFNDILPAVPNCFLEVNPKSQEFDAMMSLAINNGAIGARGIFNLQNYGNANPVYDRKAYTFTLAYRNRELRIYSTYPLPSVQRSPPISPRVFHFSGSSVPLPHKCHYRSPLRKDSTAVPTPPVAKSPQHYSPVEPPIPTVLPTYDGNVYITTLVTSFTMNLGSKEFQEAITAFRNCCDWAEQQRKAFVERANRVARGENPDL